MRVEKSHCTDDAVALFIVKVWRLKIEPLNFSLRKVYLTYARAKYIIYARA